MNNLIEFLDFSSLQNTQNSISFTQPTKKTLKRKNNASTNTSTNASTNAAATTKNKTEDKYGEKLRDQEMAIMHDNINKGDYVRIIRQNGSLYNYYKGYVGEVKSYNKNSKTASICILGLPHIRTVQFPATHFVKVYNVC